MDEPEFRTSRIAIALGFLAVLAVGGGGFLLGQGTASRPAAATPPALPPAAEAPAAPRESPLLGRADLLALARGAADAYASGTPLPKEVSDATGRRFDLLMPLGCNSASDHAPGSSSWSYDDKRGRLHITIPPVSWTAADWTLSDDTPVEAIEGFWIARPWSSSSACPPSVSDPAQADASAATSTASGDAAAPAKTSDTAPGSSAAKPSASDQNGTPASPAASTAPAADETLAIAQFFTVNGNSGIRRSGRPYSIVTRVTPDQFNASQGFSLRLTGRIDRAPGGDPVRCVQPKGRDNPPVCVIATVVDEVRVENPATGAVLATWGAGHSSR